MADRLVFDDFRAEFGGGRENVGEFVFGGPFEMEIKLDYTGLRGSGSNLYYAYVFQLPKWDYKLKKVDEWIEVTPMFAEYYNITIEQKHKLEAAIKSGLAGAAAAVTDYELIAHDSRRYREILDYFKQATNRDEHVLRNLFVDRVDAFTGDYALIQMARRWPTIISDFIRMKEGLTEISEIRKELDVSTAEANILKTKNELFKEWKALFLPAVKERYARIATLMNARKKSIDEYRKWLKPYVARYKMIREKQEERPQEFLSNAYMTPGFGQSQASTGVRLWTWKPFTPQEKGIAPARKWKRGGLKTKFIIDPYDKIVKEWQAKVEERYGVKYTEEDIRKLIDKAVQAGELNPNFTYYVFFDVNIQLNLVRTPPPQGTELDNLVFQPLKAYVISQNVLLMLLIEIAARESSFEKHINELIGSREHEEEELKRLEEELMPKKPEKKSKIKDASHKTGKWGRKGRNVFEKIFYIFVKRGPYETNFEERITKMYFRAAGGLYGQQVGYILSKMGVE